MATATFDTLKFANTLKAAGVPAAQAEAQAVAFADVIQVNFKELSTKDDLGLLKADLDRLGKELKRDITDESVKLNARMDVVAAKHSGEIATLRWMMTAVLGLLTALVVRAFFPRL